LEDVIRAAPEQWVWMHRRWRIYRARPAPAESQASGATPEPRATATPSAARD
jgi:hypothetical protein